MNKKLTCDQCVLILEDMPSDAATENPFELEPLEDASDSQSDNDGVKTKQCGSSDDSDGPRHDEVTSDKDEDSEKGSVMCEDISDEEDNSEKANEGSDDDDEASSRAYSMQEPEDSDKSEVHDLVTPKPVVKRQRTGQDKTSNVANSCKPTTQAGSNKQCKS